MIRVRDISMPEVHTKEDVITEAIKILGISKKNIIHSEIVKKSLDARKKPDIRFIYTVDLKLTENESKVIKLCKKASFAPKFEYNIPKASDSDRPVIIGFGPAGMFAALVLAIAGCRPIVIERGEDALSRQKKIERFWETGVLDTKSNVQFGEGGAGTFSDGKLNTGVKNPRIKWVLQQFVDAGADENILYDSKPHIGTDVLINIVQEIRKKIISLGGEVHFNSKFTAFKTKNSHITEIVLESGDTIECSSVILAIGHSARDTFRMLNSENVPMEPKPFAIGVRIEHCQNDIDFSQYGKCSPFLPAADYKLVSHLEDRTVYTFCMCPGGYVVAAASENFGVVTNGMSLNKRDGKNANSALLVTVNPSDFEDKSSLGGMLWQVGS